jgi:Enoyl-(Acyl carrier protein) reductase
LHGLTQTEAYAQELQVLVSTTPLGRMSAVDAIAQVAVFLASDDSSDITGIERFVDGGMAKSNRSARLTRSCRPCGRADMISAIPSLRSVYGRSSA